MAGLVPAIHAFLAAKTWMPGTRPGMTMEGQSIQSADTVHDQRGAPIMDKLRRILLKTGAAVTAMAAAPRAFAQQASPANAGTSKYQRGEVQINFEQTGAGFPLLLIPGGGLNSTIAGMKRGDPFNPIEEFKAEYRCIVADLRNASGGTSIGPLETERPWDAFTDDHLGLMDHLGIDKFLVMGFCIGGPLIWNLIKRAPDRVVAAVLAQPSGSRPEMRDYFYENNMKVWAPQLIKRRPEIKMETVDRFLTRMYRNNPDFVISVTRDFVRSCQTPVLILPDDIVAHPYAVAMEAAMLAPKSEVSMFPWKEPKERIPLAVRQIHSFLKAHRPA
jgi:pimeloyl-ACP methyl ester carboxylesterase